MGTSCLYSPQCLGRVFAATLATTNAGSAVTQPAPLFAQRALELMRRLFAGEETIFEGILTDRGLGISESVLQLDEGKVQFDPRNQCVHLFANSRLFADPAGIERRSDLAKDAVLDVVELLGNAESSAGMNEARAGNYGLASLSPWRQPMLAHQANHRLLRPAHVLPDS